MIVLFTDFGSAGPYAGQVKAQLARHAPSETVIDLLHEVPAFNAHAGAHLLAALAPTFPGGSVFLAVVDPGVGTSRGSLVVEADGRHFVGPDNGLLSVVVARAAAPRCWRITWRPEALAPTFHGRDLFARIAAELAVGSFPEGKLLPIDAPDVQFDAGDLGRVVYVDPYGNAWTGIRRVSPDARIAVGDTWFHHAETFGAVEKGEGFWYVNSAGLVELAVNRGSAASVYGLQVGDTVQICRPN